MRSMVSITGGGPSSALAGGSGGTAVGAARATIGAGMGAGTGAGPARTVASGGVLSTGNGGTD